MRLIDADALHQTYMKWFKKQSINNGTTTKAIVLADALMRNEPKVDAIPVEWLLEWEQKYNENLPQLFRGDTVIKEVIRDWRAENEAD